MCRKIKWKRDDVASPLPGISFHLVSVDGEPCLRFPDRIKHPSDGSYVRFKRKIKGEIKGLTAAARRAWIAGEQMRFIGTHDCAAACIYETIRLRSVSDSSVASVYTVGTKKRLQLYSVPLYVHWKGGNRGAHNPVVSEFVSNYSNSVWWTLQMSCTVAKLPVSFSGFAPAVDGFQEMRKVFHLPLLFATLFGNRALEHSALITISSLRCHKGYGSLLD